MEYVVISVAALVAAGLAFFSGFGLGTLLLPAFIFFLPVPVAVAATAFVHLTTNIFRGAIVGNRADRGTVLRFGLAAVPAAVFGAWVLGRLAHMPVWFTYTIGSRGFEGTPVKIAIGLFIAVFAAAELVPAARQFNLPSRLLPLGGLISGFLGGFSGHQGAVRTTVLLKAGLTAAAFIGTTAMITVGVDTARLIVYGTDFYRDHFNAIAPHAWTTVATAAAAAIAGTLLGRRFMKNMTIGALRAGIGVVLMLSGLALTAGLL